MKIVFTLEAKQRIRTVAIWWRKNRSAAPKLFREELAEAQTKILKHPMLGQVHSTVRGKQVRRILLPKTEQHLYYSVDEANDTLLIHIVWGARRGKPPQL